MEQQKLRLIHLLTNGDYLDVFWSMQNVIINLIKAINPTNAKQLSSYILHGFRAHGSFSKHWEEATNMYDKPTLEIIDILINFYN